MSSHTPANENALSMLPLSTVSAPLGPRVTGDRIPIRCSHAPYEAARRVARERGVTVKNIVDAALMAYTAMLSACAAEPSSNSTNLTDLKKDGLSGGKPQKSRAIDRLPPKSRERK